ncbi:uncharacterized protein LOC129565552, partial [Sitodiplosis mosellana]|uniref:uncharacterized protein LOC129565552 n=1 Tax=Sitodiplosis mosellana TaxID=263140 RepID=UPI002443C42E
MASKFMAFEGVASTSSASMENHGNAEDERIEMNSSQYPNYQSGQSPGIQAEPSPYGAVDEEDDLNDNFEEKFEKNMGYRKFIFNNCEQFKCIFGGLLLLAGSGIHVVWGIFRVFYLYNCEEKNSFHFHFVIWSWYIGAIIGSGLAGYAIAKIRKGHLYIIGGALLSLSGIFLMFSTNNTDIYLLVSRTLGGLTQGLTYVVVIVHASENATKEFREILMLIVGAVLNYSILLSVLAFFHTEGLFKSSVLNGIGLLIFGLTTIIISTKHATETVPFILQNDGGDLDALQTVSKLKKKPIAARSVHHDFLTMKNLVHDEMESYGAPNFKKVLLPENRKSLIFCLYGRLCSVLSFNLPLIVMIMLFLRQWADGHFETPKHHAKQHCLSFINGDIERGRTENHTGEIDSKVVERAKRDSGVEVSTDKPKFMQTDNQPVQSEKSEENKKGKSKQVSQKTEDEENRARKDHEEGKENKKEKEIGGPGGKHRENESKGERDDSKSSLDQENGKEQTPEGKSKKPEENHSPEEKKEKEKEKEKVEEK